MAGWEDGMDEEAGLAAVARLRGISEATRRAKMQVQFEFPIGFCWTFRRWLNNRQRDGMEFEFQEGRGWFKRSFTIKGAAGTIMLLLIIASVVFESDGADI